MLTIDPDKANFAPLFIFMASAYSVRLWAVKDIPFKMALWRGIKVFIISVILVVTSLTSITFFKMINNSNRVKIEDNLHNARCAAVNFLNDNNITFNNAYVLNNSKEKKVIVVISPVLKYTGGEKFENKIAKLELNQLFNIKYQKDAPMVGSPKCLNPDIQLEDIH